MRSRNKKGHSLSDPQTAGFAGFFRRRAHSAATGRTVTVLGNDVMQVEGEKIRSVEVNYNRQAVDDQLRGTAP